MKIVFSESDVKEIVAKAAMELAPIGTVPEVEISTYSVDFVKVNFVNIAPATATEEDTTVVDEKPIDLSDIPF